MSIRPKKQESASAERPLDPNIKQHRASEPSRSVWVGASAGTGKTKVLTDRVLRLLLPGKDGMPGTPPQKILCLTFTKAGASEMALRLSEKLSSWAVLPHEGRHGLEEQLKDLLGRVPSQADINAARQLFARVIDSPGRLNIMTLHSFCQSVLARFPLEAGISPNFRALDEHEASLLLAESIKSTVTEAAASKGTPSYSAFENIAQLIDEDSFFALVSQINGERNQLENILEKNFGVEGLYAKICETLNIPQNVSSEDLKRQACVLSPEAEAGLKEAGLAMSTSTSADEARFALGILNWIESETEQRLLNFGNYRDIFITGKGAPRTKSFPNSATKKKFPFCEEYLRKESARLIDLDEQCAAANIAFITRDLFLLSTQILRHYEAKKSEHFVLDFNDLIHCTLALLEGKTVSAAGENTAHWVQYKLDQGIDHILIDEAQDTNPEQWRIIETLAKSFFEGLSAREENRTVFIVGDEKQSIYSFQRAAPQEFERMRIAMERHVKAAKKIWDDVDMTISFRSAQMILNLVDSIFANSAHARGLGSKMIHHESFRRGQSGLIELWPLFEAQRENEDEAWDMPLRTPPKKTAAASHAEYIAKTISGWIDKEELPARERKVKAGDIMILVRTRNNFVDLLSRTLKDHGIPVSGLDRMVLNEQIVVQDLLAFAEFSLLPSDDLTLATLLKSPLIGLSESDLYELSALRGSSTLWQSLKISAHTNVYAYLQNLIQSAQKQTPFGFFSNLLQNPCPADPISGMRAIRVRLGPGNAEPVTELLNAALNYERDHTPNMQLFLQHQRRGSGDIKREMEEPKDEVRIMTIHGAKGLQAPIVILPDTIRTARSGGQRADNRLLWPDKTELQVPLWSPRNDMNSALYTSAKETIDERMEEEYRRLLYVALTRAEDRLYIGGHRTQTEPLPGSWYNMVYSGFMDLPHVEAFEDGRLRASDLQIKPPDRREESKNTSAAKIKPPSWVFVPAPPEMHPPKPLMPSRFEDAQPPALSPFQKHDPYRFRRGVVTHKLLQYLPAIPEDRRSEAAAHFLSRHAHDLPETMRQQIGTETCVVLSSSEFKDVFGPSSLAEVPVTGISKDGRVISGQIDRLLVRADEIMIVDYKTNRLPPRDAAQIPEIYKSQMQAYANILASIYPGRAITCAILWTDGPFLTPLKV